MLRLTSRHTPRVSNRLAVIAALMLLVSALVNMSGSAATSTDSIVQTAEKTPISAETYASETAEGNTRKKNKGFKVSLFLFRSG